jgi:hypothetical protein
MGCSVGRLIWLIEERALLVLPTELSEPALFESL